MVTLRSRLVVLGCLASLGCSGPEGEAAAPPGAQPGANLAPAAPVQPGDGVGALIKASMNSKVGVVLDELPVGMRSRVAASLIAKPASYWQERAKMQVRLTGYRLVFREYFYGGKKQLPLPPENIWNIQIQGAPTRQVINGHDVVAVNYAFDSILLTDSASPAISENKLAQVGGFWNEPFVFPVDPELVYQRTGYACMDEEDFPKDSVDSEEVDTFYDHTCAVERTASSTACHQTELPTESCVQALENHVGRVDAFVRFERLPWDPAVANSVRVYPPTTESADLEVYLEDFLINRVEYKYFAPGSCEEQEQCIGAPGWRRVLQFNSSDQNRGKQTLDIGAVDYYLTGKETLNDKYNIFDLHECHQHYHFSRYGQFSFDAPGANVTNKQGFCLQSTARSANHESSPLHNPYGGCDYQGVAAGWVDQYKIGLPCQWVDITDVDTTVAPVTANLGFKSNPDGFLCEGTPVVDANGNLVFEETELTNHHGEIQWRPKCTYSEGWDLNNEHTYPVTVTKPGDTYVTGACERGQVGPLRNCGLKLAQERINCTPGAQVTLRCTVNGSNPPQVARVCERSTALNTSMACIERRALASEVIETTRDVSLTCPAPKFGEAGGQISVFTGAAFPDDRTAGLTCTLL